MMGSFGVEASTLGGMTLELVGGMGMRLKQSRHLRTSWAAF